MATQFFTTSINGTLAPTEVAEAFTVAVLSGNPFARALRRLPITRTSISFPLVSPSGLTWVSEGAALPEVDLGEDVYVSTPVKLAGIFDVSAEAIEDAEQDLASLLGMGVAQAALAVLDDGLMNGSGTPPEPAGALTVADTIAGGAAPIRAGVFTAVGEILAAGGTPTHVALNPLDFVAEAGREDSQQRPIYPNGLTQIAGCTPIAVPVLEAGTVLVFDATRAMLVQRDALSIDIDKSAGFRTDTAAVRVRGRFSLAVPVASQAVRKFTIAPAG